MKKIIIKSTCAILGLSLLVAFAQQSGGGLFFSPKQVYFSGAITVEAPDVNSTLDDFWDASIANPNPLAPPTGWPVIETAGTTTATLTGRIRLDGTSRLRITFEDDISDLSFAQAYVDGVLVSTATRANGKILDDAATSLSTATMLMWLPADYPFTVELVVTEPGGVTDTQLIDLK